VSTAPRRRRHTWLPPMNDEVGEERASEGGDDDRVNYDEVGVTVAPAPPQPQPQPPPVLANHGRFRRFRRDSTAFFTPTSSPRKL